MADSVIAPAPLRRCSKCNQHKPATGEFFSPLIRKGRKPSWQSYCKVCRAAEQAAWREANPELSKQSLKKSRLAHPERVRESHERWAARNPRWKADYQKRYAAELRAEMLAAYGGHCACCGLTEPSQFLTLEHVNRDGAAHRARVGGQSTQTYLELRRLGWPEAGLTLLCWNCQKATWSGGACAHTPDYRPRGRPTFRRLREGVIAAYGGGCECCGITDVRFLVVSTGPAGEEYRARYPDAERFYSALGDAGWPEGVVTVLCWNCSMGRAHHGVCPHRKEPNLT